MEPRYWTVLELKRGADYRGYHVRERTPAFDFLKEKALTGVSLRGLEFRKLRFDHDLQFFNKS